MLDIIMSTAYTILMAGHWGGCKLLVMLYYIFNYWGILMGIEVNNSSSRYYLNDAGDIHGEYTSSHANGRRWESCHFNNGKIHGEYKSWLRDGRIVRTHRYYANGVEVHDFLEEDSELIRTCLYMTHGAPWLGGSDVT